MKGSELRQDPATKEWVVIAPDRAKRPNAAAAPRNHPVAPPAAQCPFCPGHEFMTPPELLRIPAGPDWQVRVVPNKFGAMSPEATPERHDGFFRTVAGAGYHEVIIEDPRHDLEFADMSEEQIANVLCAYRQRQVELSRDPKVQFVVIFRNYGERAGTSLLHPHSQLLATPVMPAYVRWKHELAERYFDDTHRNLYGDILENERTAGQRVVEDGSDFTVFAPFASFVPYEMWIMPHTAKPSFALASDEELHGLSGVLRRSLLRLRNCCGPVDYNFVIHSCATRELNEEYYLWHLQIIPRLTQPAGFELGSHMYINPTLPEEGAQQLREASSPPMTAAAIPA